MKEPSELQTMTEGQRRQYNRMTKTPVYKLVMSMAIPSTAGMLITSLYNFADTYFVASIGTSATAAVGVVFALQAIIQAVGYGFSMGCQALSSMALGKKEQELAQTYASSAVFGAFTLGLVIALIGLAFTQPVMRCLGATDTILPYAVAYSRIILAGAPVICFSYVLGNILKCQGLATRATFGLCSGGFLNIALDYWFIVVLGHGVQGAALATVISQVVSGTILVFFIMGKKSTIHLSFRFVSRNIHTYQAILTAGLPTVSRQSMGSIATAVLNIQAAAFGDAAVAAVSIAMKCYGIMRNLIRGIGQSFQPVAGYNYGAKSYNRVRSAFRTAVYLGGGICILASTVGLFLAKNIMLSFQVSDYEVIQIGTHAIKMLCLALPGLSFSTYVNQLYQCLGFSRSATVLALCRQGFFFIPLLLILPNLIGLNGLLLAQPLADLFTFFISIPCYYVFLKRHLPSRN